MPKKIPALKTSHPKNPYLSRYFCIGYIQEMFGVLVHHRPTIYFIRSRITCMIAPSVGTHHINKRQTFV